MRLEIPNMKETAAYLKQFKGKREQAFLILQYLSACRISELARHRLGYKNFLPSIKKEQLIKTTQKDRKILLLKQVRNLKNKTFQTKNIPIPLDKEPERSLALILLRYIKKVNGEEIFPHTRQWFWLATHGRIRHWLDYNEHILNPLRHVRLSHLAVDYNFTDQQLTKFAGWADSRPAKNYIRMKWEDIIPSD